jgi:hypothetical protein
LPNGIFKIFVDNYLQPCSSALRKTRAELRNKMHGYASEWSLGETALGKMALGKMALGEMVIHPSEYKLYRNT